VPEEPFTLAFNALKKFYDGEGMLGGGVQRSLKMLEVPVIDGASGCGKTRIGWELFKQLRHDYGVGAIQYHYLQFIDWVTIANDHDTSGADKVLKQSLLAGAQVIADNSAVSGRVDISKLHLANILDACIPPRPEVTSQRALVLHIDEFQDHVLETTAILRKVRDYNSSRGGGSEVLLLPVLTGLIANPMTTALAQDGVSGMRLTPVRLQYFGHDMDRNWRLVTNVMAALKSPHLASYPTFCDAPALLQQLVEDTFGWPIALLLLASTIARFRVPQTNRSPLLTDAVAATHTIGRWNDFEEEYLKSVAALYPSTLFTNALGLKEGLKLLLLALSPHAVSGDEEINGSTVERLPQYGLVDVRPKKDSNNTLYYLRISLPLLRILNDTHKLLDPGLLQTCRFYFSRLQEHVQGVSLAISMAAWCTLKKKDGPLRYETLRPRITVWAGSGYPQLSQALVADGSKIAEWCKLHSQKMPTSVKQFPTFGIMLSRNEAGNDLWAWLHESLLVVMQTKGQQTGQGLGLPGSDAAMTAGEADKVFRAMRSAARVGRVDLKNMVCELLTTRTVSEVSQGGADVPMMLLHRGNLSSALGPVFAALVGRITQPMPEEPVRLFPAASSTLASSAAAIAGAAEVVAASPEVVLMEDEVQQSSVVVGGKRAYQDRGSGEDEDDGRGRKTVKEN